MTRMKIGLLLVVVLIAGYAMHKLIRRFINPKLSANHFFLYFLAHFVGLFILSFLVNLLIINFSGYLFGGA